MKYRDFTYKKMKFHLNDNKGNLEFEGKYDVMWWNESCGRWESLFTADTKAEAEYTVRQFYKAKRGCWAA